MRELSQARESPHYVVRPLSTLARADARALVRRLYAPDQRFARAFYRYWRDVVGQSVDEAQASTAEELAQNANAILADLSDPHIHAVGLEDGTGYHAIGMFSFRPLDQHAQGRVLSQYLDSTGLRGRYPGRLAIAHAVALIDEQATRAALETILLSIAVRSLSDGFSFVFFYTSDDRLVPLYRHFGMDFPRDLRFPHSAHTVGVYDVGRPANDARMRTVAQRLGVELGPLAEREPLRVP